MLTARIEDPKRTPKNPISTLEILGKYRIMTTKQLGAAAGRVLERVMRIKNLPSMKTFFCDVSFSDPNG